MAKRVDANQREIVKGIRRTGATVLILSMVGKGCPDLLVGRGGKNYLIELKDSAKPASKKQLTQDEKDFFRNWSGQAAVCETLEDVLSTIGTY